MLGDESAYVENLDHERHLLTWCLVRYGGMALPIARSQAEAFYRYESAEPRGLVFHDEAWHWAMLKLLGEQYWLVHPELANPSADDRAESRRYEQSKRLLE
jgi:hypothetical protein